MKRGSILVRLGFALSCALVLAGVAGCVTGRGSAVSDGVLSRSPAFDVVLDAGMAVAPVGHVDPVIDSAEITAFLTNEVYVNLLVSLRDVPLVAPRDVLEQMSLVGEGAFERFRQVRREMVRGETPSRDDLAELSRIVMHRFLLVTWVDERKEMGMEEMSQDYVESGFANDVRRAVYEKIHGSLHGVVVDLWEGEVMWRGVADYDTPRLYGETEGVKTEVELARNAGAARFAMLMASP